MSQSAQKNRLYTSAQTRELDRLAIEEHGIPGIRLMKRAGAAAFEALFERWPDLQRISVFCGSGNNGGDGYIVAALAAQRNLSVRLIELGKPDRMSADARQARVFARTASVEFVPFAGDLDLSKDIIVDALLGTGFNGEVREAYAAAITLINKSERPVLSIDVPSGLASDTGAVANCAIEADLTVTFIAVKQGLYTGRGPALTGKVLYRDLNVPRAIFDKISATSYLMEVSDLLSRIPARKLDAHKNQFGHLMIIGGDTGYGGAVLMAAEAALRGGAGLVSVATRPSHVAAVLSRTPEVMAVGVTSGVELDDLMRRPSVLVVGPGLGHSAWSEQMLNAALQSGLPLLLDADALNLIASTEIVDDRKQHSPWVMTPHPGEAARLLGVSTGDISANRFAAVRQLQEMFNAVTLLKGAGTLIATKPEQPVAVCPYGNPGMATGGMGDVLSGLIGGLLAQGLNCALATQLGCCIHALAADRAVLKTGEMSLLPTDLIAEMPALLSRKTN